MTDYDFFNQHFKEYLSDEPSHVSIYIEEDKRSLYCLVHNKLKISNDLFGAIIRDENNIYLFIKKHDVYKYFLKSDIDNIERLYQDTNKAISTTNQLYIRTDVKFSYSTQANITIRDTELLYLIDILEYIKTTVKYYFTKN